MKHVRAVEIFFIVILIVGGTSMDVFGLLGFAGTEKWKEEVKLTDGRLIIVEREVQMERGGDEWASNRGGTKPKEYRIKFAHPDRSRKMIEWRSTKESPGTYPEKPLILDMESGQPVVFTIVSISNTEEIYCKYVYRSGLWVEEALPDTFEKRNTNLYLKIGRDFIDLQTKRKNNAKPGYSINLIEVGPKRKVAMHIRR
jgi:hypothetical protein